MSNPASGGPLSAVSGVLIKVGGKLLKGGLPGVGLDTSALKHLSNWIAKLGAPEF